MIGRSPLILPGLAVVGWLAMSPVLAREPMADRLQLAGWFDDLFTNAPSGSYRSSCRDERVKNQVLTAECRRKNGDYRDASLDLRGCNGDILNDNGKLVCHKNKTDDRPREGNGGGPFAGKD